jgi:hypothetical protein
MDTSEPRPIGLSDAQMSAVMAAAATLHEVDRDPFLHTVANLLRGESDPGDAP